jgi:tRNA 2-thiouridine synthesizing protein A
MIINYHFEVSGAGSLDATATKPIMQVDEVLDTKGLNCPLPILKTKVLLNKLQPGQIVYVLSTDPHSVIDFEAYCARTKHELLKICESEDLYEFYIRRAEYPEKY